MSRDVYKAIGYEKENGKKAIQNLVYKLRFGDINSWLNQREDIFPLHKDTVLLKEPGLHRFLLHCKKSKAEQFMVWVVETVLHWEIQKLASVIEEKDAALAHRDNQIQAPEFANEEHHQGILRLNEEIDDLITNRYVARRGSFDNELCFITFSSPMLRYSMSVQAAGKT